MPSTGAVFFARVRGTRRSRRPLNRLHLFTCLAPPDVPLPVSVSEYTLTEPSKEAVARMAGNLGDHRASKFQLLPEGRSHMICPEVGFLYAYIYMHMYINKCIYIYVRMHARACAHTSSDLGWHVNIYLYICICMYTYTRVHAHDLSRTGVPIYSYVKYMYIRARTNIHTRNSRWCGCPCRKEWILKIKNRKLITSRGKKTR